MEDRSYMRTIRKHQDEPPVNVVAIAKELGLTVYSAPKFTDNISGMIRRNDEGGYDCFVNANHHENRQRFTIAHECAHFCLHRDLIERNDGLLRDDAYYRSSFDAEVERQANGLAAEILMPKHLMMREEYRHLDSFELSKMFRVSESAMNVRKSVLGL